MKKILLFIPSLFNSAGTERISTSLANALHEKGYDVDFVVHSSNTESFYKLHSDINVYSLSLNGNVNIHKLKAAIRLRKLIKHHRYEAIINVGVACANVTMLVVPQILGCKVISWEHFSIKGLNFKRRFKHYISTFFSNHTIVLTNADRSAYPKIFNSKMAVIPNFTDINPLQNISPLSNKVVLACGRLEEEVKRFDLLLKIWSMVHDELPEWNLRIVGDGDSSLLYDEAKKLGINDSVQFAGRCNDMSREYLMSSLFVVTSKYESFSLVIIESKSFGVPVVSFDCPFGPREIIQNGIDGLLIENGNIEAFSKAMILLMKDKEMRLNMGQRAVLDYYDKWSVNKVIDKWLIILKD